MRVLVITHTFPPSFYSNAKRPAYLVRGMLEAGWDVEVLTSRFGMEAEQEETMVHERCRIERIPNFGDWITSMLGRGGRLERVLDMLANGVLFPDRWMPWSRTVFDMCGSRKHRFDRIVAFVHPPSLLLSGNYRGLVDRRWVFDFQESVSPQYKVCPRKSPLQRWLTPRLERLERLSLHLAGRVVFTAESNRRAYVDSGLVEREVTEHIPYFYDTRDFVDAGTIGEDFEIGYYGNFDLGGQRTPAVFMKSLARFLARHPEARTRTRFVFYGTWLRFHDKLVDENGLRDVVQINSAVSYPEYLLKIKDSPILLLVVSSGHNLFMPSKIVDYFGARRPILAFVPRDSEMRKVLVDAGMGGFSCFENDVDGGSTAIERLWELYLVKKLDCDTSRTGYWSSDIQVSRYLELLQNEAEDLPDSKCGWNA